MTLDRTKPPVIHDAVEFDYKLPPLNTTTLDNGLPLYWVDAGVQDVVQIDWVFPAGLWFEQKEAVAHATAGLLKNGTSKHTSEQISEALEFYGAQLKTSAGNDFATVTLYSLTKHLPALLPMVLEILTEATYPEHEVEIYKRNVTQRLLVNLRQCEFVANQRIDALLFGEHHPYGRFTKQATIDAINREDLLAYYKGHYSLANVRMFMAGKVSVADVKHLNEVFGAAPIVATPVAPVAFDHVQRSERVQRISNEPNGVQGAIRIGRLFPNRHHPDYTPMVVLNTLFGGYFGSRLMSNIREDKGYTYGIHSSLGPEVNGGSLVIGTETGRDVTEAAVIEVYKEMELLCNEPADEEELLLVKNYLLGGILGDLDGPFSILQRWRTLILNGFTEEQFNRNINIYKNITTAELQALAKKYFVKEEFYEIVVI
ncbi:insulinase family protein [Flavipsychrobacter stenotrophus]|uniref:Insulinase family protein n=1 Tax=Flavipsychrobacter stenotrophus TaxID=2077091 RepID=A0A2S7SU82_9BACT|nr:pitrilysin family protein [Flavipsychrobacter stenotrophus]PQJ10482.1 insulinase family protein [Flavipsychrobacter stenotrophus]